ncbi:MAG TPA: 5-(carboxyamino)imidazole ribonucleotide synthase [Acidimicrobiia bacterium]|nr:5-(carboxyamino)imidazole ribonucleotide synthase [Acidimicrobiia bacterium]
MTDRLLVAVLGGGQLGRMLGLAGIPLGLRFRFLDPAPDACASAVGDVVTGALDDPDAVARVAQGAAAVTYEWEGVPAASARAAAAASTLAPPADALAVAQDRLAEKELFAGLGIPTARFVAVGDRSSLDAAVAEIGLPAVLKTRSGGYDGKGQAVLRAPGDVDGAWAQLGGVPLLLESFVEFERELSIVAVRGRDGTTAAWPVVENTHRDGILRVTRAPALDLDPAQHGRAEHLVHALLDALDYVGVLCVELFEAGGTLLANELAPRVHNSGHWTIEGAETSQFENHLRAVLGWPLGSTRARGVAAMVNCIGGLPDTGAIAAIAGAHLHDYGKAPRPERKVGHVTVTAADDGELAPRLAAVERAIT